MKRYRCSLRCWLGCCTRACLFVCVICSIGGVRAAWITKYGKLNSDERVASPRSGTQKSFQFSFTGGGNLSVTYNGETILFNNAQSNHIFTSLITLIPSYIGKNQDLSSHSVISGVMTGILAYLINQSALSVTSYQALGILMFYCPVSNEKGHFETVVDGKLLVIRLENEHLQGRGSQNEGHKLVVTVTFDGATYVYEIELPMEVVGLREPDTLKMHYSSGDGDDDETGASGSGGCLGTIASVASVIFRCMTGSKQTQSHTPSTRYGSIQRSHHATILELLTFGRSAIERPAPDPAYLGIEAMRHSLNKPCLLEEPSISNIKIF